MQLTSKHTLRIQSFLFSKGWIQEKASDVWTPHKHSGYKAYLESLGLPESECRETPYNLGMLPKELREFILIPSKVSVAGESTDSELDEDLDLDEDDEDEDEDIVDDLDDENSEENSTDETKYEDE